MASMRKMYDKGRGKGGKEDAGEKEAPASKETTSETKAGEEPGPAEAVRGSSEDGMAARHAQERNDLHKAHDVARRDMHGRHRTAHRDMHSRHEAEHASINHMDVAALGNLHRKHENEHQAMLGHHMQEAHQMHQGHHMEHVEMHRRHEMEVAGANMASTEPPGAAESEPEKRVAA